MDLKEVSGMEYMPGSELIWVIQDSGNESILHGLDRSGQVKAEVAINIKNNDWESIAADAKGNIYIGDFGNNDNDRTDLAIYKVDSKALKGERAEVSAAIKFRYPEQKDFPPGKGNRLFDCEAFYEHNGSFYLFTKNRSAKSDGTFYVYKIPNTAGNHPAQLIGTLKTCNDKSCQVTGADISPDGKTAVLITEDKLFMLTGFSSDNFNDTAIDVLDLKHVSQKEGVCFTDDRTLIISDERTKKTGGKLYEVNLDH